MVQRRAVSVNSSNEIRTHSIVRVVICNIVLLHCFFLQVLEMLLLLNAVGVVMSAFPPKKVLTFEHCMEQCHRKLKNCLHMCRGGIFGSLSVSCQKIYYQCVSDCKRIVLETPYKTWVSLLNERNGSNLNNFTLRGENGAAENSNAQNTISRDVRGIDIIQ